MEFRPFAVTALLTAIVAAPLSANEIYKWTDENGNVHFGDRPDGQAPERLDIASRSTDREAVQVAFEERREARATQAEERAAAAAEEPTAAELKAQATERAQKCSSYKQRMQKLVTSRRVYREDEAGERVYLDEAETLAAREQVENQISEFCGS